MITSVGLIGWRGMVGSVLMQRMKKEGDFSLINPVFFSTSDIGGHVPLWADGSGSLQDAYDISILRKLPVILTTQGGDYTTEIYPKLRKSGWKGIWIDAASSLRTNNKTIICLDPINRKMIDIALKRGICDFVGGNCTVSCMLMALAGLFNKNLIDWIIAMTYQAASGAGAKHMCELLNQFGFIHHSVKHLLDDPATTILQIDREVLNIQKDCKLPHENFGMSLAGNLIPWIDQDLGFGMSREEWKAENETNKILGYEYNNERKISIDGLCVRVGTMRCHSQALTIKLKHDIPLDEIEDLIRDGTQWTKLIPNTSQDTIKFLTPVSVTGTLDIPVGRLRKLNINPKYLSLFTIGDQLLWGAAEPLRRTLRIILDSL